MKIIYYYKNTKVYLPNIWYLEYEASRRSKSEQKI